MMPTASAVVADIIDVAIGNSARTFESLNIQPQANSGELIEKHGDAASRFYIRLSVNDQAGVFAQIAKILAENEISISGIIKTLILIFLFFGKLCIFSKRSRIVAIKIKFISFFKIII